jgi:hypothetical protein
MLEITFLEPGAAAYVFTVGSPEMATYLINHRPGGVPKGDVRALRREVARARTPVLSQAS